MHFQAAFVNKKVLTSLGIVLVKDLFSGVGSVIKISLLIDGLGHHVPRALVLLQPTVGIGQERSQQAHEVQVLGRVQPAHTQAVLASGDDEQLILNLGEIVAHPHAPPVRPFQLAGKNALPVDQFREIRAQVFRGE